MRALVAWLSLLTAASAVEVEPIQKRDTPIFIRHDPGDVVNAVFVESGKWKFLPDVHFRRGETETIMAAPPGQYLVTTGGASIIAIIEEGKPDPAPDPSPKPSPEPPEPRPDPSPNPGPVPIAAKWLVFVEEQSERSSHPKQVAVMNDPSLRSTLADLGIKVRVYDADQQAGLPFAAVAGDTRPAMILMGDASTYRVFPVPSTAAEAEATVRENLQR